MFPERLVEGVEAPGAVGFTQRIHFLKQEWMRADSALTKHDEISREDVGTLDGDADRHRPIEIPEIVLRAVDHGLAAMIYILLVQTQNERGRITPAFRKLVYDAFATDN